MDNKQTLANEKRKLLRFLFKVNDDGTRLEMNYIEILIFLKRIN